MLWLRAPMSSVMPNQQSNHIKPYPICFNYSVHLTVLQSTKLFPPCTCWFFFLKCASFRLSPGSLPHFNQISAQRSHSDILIENNFSHHPLCHPLLSYPAIFLLSICYCWRYVFICELVCVWFPGENKFQELRDFVSLVPSISLGPIT